MHGDGPITYPPYVDGLECVWLLQCPQPRVPVLRFNKLQTEAEYDYVFLYDVGSNFTLAEISRFSGHATPPGVFAAADTHLLLVFTSDITVVDAGFSVEWTCKLPNPSTSRSLAFFLKVQGEGVWCQDGQFFAEYFDDLELSGNPLATQCEVNVPNWRWHAAPEHPGIPPPLLGKTRELAPELFSARWASRMYVDETKAFTFLSSASPGSRIKVDGTTILDSWSLGSDQGDLFASEPLTLAVGYHTIAYEYRSGTASDDSPTNSYAQLSWSVGGKTFGAASGSNRTNVTSTADELYADVGWLACNVGQGSSIHGNAFESGLIARDERLTTDLQFASAFADTPRIFGSIISSEGLSSHLRLLETAPEQATVAIEYDTCHAVFVNAEAKIGWIALAAIAGQSVHVRQRQTLPTDTSALLAIGAALRLPEYLHWRNNSDPCADRWTGVECRTDASGTPRIVVLDIHHVDLTNQDIPWSFIGQLTGLEEISMYDCGLTGIISEEFACRLTSLQVLALQQNKLRGTIPECLSTLPLEWLWLEDNNIHGPLPELSVLGQFLKGMSSRSLHRNHWTPLLASEKQVLEDVSGPLGVATHPNEGDWDFAYSYAVEWASGAVEDRLMAERDVSYRQWSAGMQNHAFMVELPFRFPSQGNTLTGIGIGRDGLFGTSYNLVSGLPRGDCYSIRESRICGSASQSSLNFGGEPDRAIDGDTNSAFSGGSCTHTDVAPAWFQLDLGTHAYIDEVHIWHRSDCCQHRLESANIVVSTTPDFQSSGVVCSMLSDGTQEPEVSRCGGQIEGRYVTVDASANGVGASAGSIVTICEIAVYGLSSQHMGQSSLGSNLDTGTNADMVISCWSTLPALVFDPHTISEESTDRSSQGEAYFAERFCPGWSTFIFASCDPAKELCDGGTTRRGNAIVDGGDDMYDIGNLMTTSLMADCDTANDIHDCALGSLVYQSAFERVPTNCFGGGGHYQMQQLEGMWMFFTTNTHGSPIDFTITGNLGSDDGSGSVTEYLFDVPPHAGFVKRECGDEHDPSVNHMIIVDSSQGTPTHTCSGGTCTGSSSGLDDDTVAGIAPGSPILYLLYSTEGGSCMKEDEHRAIFDLAALCILAADPFSTLNRRQNTASRLLVEVDVDDQSHIMFGGSAPYVGWTRGTPTKVIGPSGPTVVNALQFSGHEYSQLGDDGVGIEGNWTLDCWVQIDAARLVDNTEGVLVQSLDEVAHVSMGQQGQQRSEVGSEAVAGMWSSSGIDMAARPEGWVRLSVSARRSVDQADMYSYFLDGGLQASVQLEATQCSEALCPVNFFAIGGRADGSAPFQLPIHRLRIFAGALSPSELDASGLPVGELARYQPENSRSIMLSRGTDAIEVKWDTVGCEYRSNPFPTFNHAAVSDKLLPIQGMPLSTTASTRRWTRWGESGCAATMCRRCGIAL